MMSFSEALKVLLPSFTGKVWLGLAASPSRKAGSTVAGSLPMMPASAARSVPWPLPVALRLPNRLHLQRGRLGQLVGRQLGAALVEIVGDPHRPDRVRRGRAGPDLVEFLDRGHGSAPWTAGRRRGWDRAVAQRRAGRRGRRRGGCWAKAAIGRPVSDTIAAASALRIMNVRRSEPGGGSVWSSSGSGVSEEISSRISMCCPIILLRGARSPGSLSRLPDDN